MGLGGFVNYVENFNAGLVKTTLYVQYFLVYFLMFLIDAIKLKSRKEIQNLFYFFRRFVSFCVMFIVKKYSKELNTFVICFSFRKK